MAQEENAPAPKRHGVQITFVPPPMEGTLSLGVFDEAGKLVRILKREATEKEFTLGLNGLITQWDGKNEAGAAAPPGKYSVRGYAVGELDVEGVAIHGNDWVTDEDSPRVQRILDGAFLVGGADQPSEPRYRFTAKAADGATVLLELNATGELVRQAAVEAAPSEPARDVAVRDGRVFLLEDGAELELPGVAGATYAFRLFDAAAGERPRVNAGSIWVIENAPEGVEVKQFLSSGEFRRRLKIAPEDPQPVAVSASAEANQLMLIEEAAGHQRVRILALEAVEPNEPKNSDAPPVQSTWRTVLSRSIHTSDKLAAAASHLSRERPFAAEEKCRVKLVPNPLLKDSATELDVKLGVDPTGSFISTLDGLPLQQLTETPHLKWAAVGRQGSGKLLTVLQSDGAVVEEFRVRKLANMMAFDAGEYELTQSP
jgi:hypothetical protein